MYPKVKDFYAMGTLSGANLEVIISYMPRRNQLNLDLPDDDHQMVEDTLRVLEPAGVNKRTLGIAIVRAFFARPPDEQIEWVHGVLREPITALDDIRDELERSGIHCLPDLLRSRAQGGAADADAAHTAPCRGDPPTGLKPGR